MPAIHKTPYLYTVLLQTLFTLIKYFVRHYKCSFIWYSGIPDLGPGPWTLLLVNTFVALGSVPVPGSCLTLATIGVVHDRARVRSSALCVLIIPLCAASPFPFPHETCVHVVGYDSFLDIPILLVFKSNPIV